jgi:uncharacterized protein (DUF488 family)
MEGTVSGKTVFTVGHSTHPIQEFFSLLHRHEIDAIADVRSVPYSQWQPQFNREDLTKTLKAQEIAYVFLGKELGARSDDPSCYENGRVSYRRLSQTELFRLGLERVLNGSQHNRIALMCAEKDPLECHRTVLVARELVTRGTNIMHVHADGHLESHSDAVQRLLKQAGLPEHDLFRSPTELIEEAYASQEKRIAYVDEELSRQVREVHQ